MTNGYVFAGDHALGSGFVVAAGVVLTCAHVIRDRPSQELNFRAESGDLVPVEFVVADNSSDVAMLGVPLVPPAAPALAAPAIGADWRVTSRPMPNDPMLTGIIIGEREIDNVYGLPMRALQLHVMELLGSYAGYSGSAIYTGDTIVGMLAEQVPERVRAPTGSSRASNILYGLPITLAVTRFGLDRNVTPPASSRSRKAPRLTLKELDALVTALLELDEMVIAPARQKMILAMPMDIRSAVDHSDSSRQHIVSWIRVCNSTKGGRDAFVDVLKAMVADRDGLTRVLELIDQLWQPDC